jgi:putative membrane protein
MNANRSVRRTTTRLGVLSLASAAVVILPTVALAADGGAPTIRSTIGADGTVKDTTQYTPDGVESGFDGDMPLKMTISHTASGGQQSFGYHVENTFSRTQSLTYTDTAGKIHKTGIQLQLPLVAQLGVDVPAAMGAIDAGTATVSTTPDGVRHVLWNFVLFTPLGSPVQDVTLTTAKNGTPVAELRATSVDPSSTPGLSASGQAATASYQQDDFWAQYASGANGGLTLIKDGLSQLLAGIIDGADGAKQLADGSAEAYAGSQDLSSGLGQIFDGQGALTKGLFQISDGQGDLTQGLKKIHNGQGDLTDGISQIHLGQGQLTTGLTQIAGGLGQLADPVEGLPAAVDGIGQLQAGVASALAGVGDDATPQTILNGVAQLSGGLQLVIDGINNQLVPGLQCLAVVENDIVNGASSGAIAANPCYQVIDVSAFMVGGALPGVAAIDPTFLTNPLNALVFGLAALTDGFVTNAVAGINDPDPTAGLVAALGALKDGADQLHFGITHAAGTLGPSDPGGLKQGLQLINGGLLALLDPTTGLPAAVDGINQLFGGASDAVTGSQQLTDGSADALDGSQQLTDGSGDALAGSRKLRDGAADAADGSQKLTDGTGEAYAGSKDLVDGLGQIADGQEQVAAGLPDAVDGIGQLIDGVGQAQDDAVGPLASQLTQASQNSHKQLAVLRGAAELAASGPGGAGATYVLTQSTRGFSLAADSSGSSHTTRNVGIGVGIGGAVMLLVGLGAGMAMGRRRIAA